MDTASTSNFAERVLAKVRKESLERFLLSEPLVVAVSGGSDSLSLLHLLIELRGKRARDELLVAHFNHASRGEASDSDAEFVRAVAEANDLEFATAKADVPALARRLRLSFEDAARQARYRFLGELATAHAASIALGHTADDQAETVMMHLLRGSGLRGLAGMRMLSEYRVSSATDSALGVQLFRPLLAVWRHEVEAYCRELGLTARYDETNADPGYLRNRIRHRLLPLLEREYNPAARAHLVSLATLAADEQELIDQLALEKWQQLKPMQEGGSSAVFRQGKFAELPSALRRSLARLALLNVTGTLRDFTFDHIEATLGVLSGTSGAPRAIDLPNGAVVEQQGGVGRVRLREEEDGRSDDREQRWPLVPRDVELRLEPDSELALDVGWRLRASVHGAPHHATPHDLTALFDLEKLDGCGSLVVRTRRPGDHIAVLGLRGRKKLQDLLVDARIPQYVRDRLALVAFDRPGGELLWVPGPGGRRSCHATVDGSTRTLLVLQFSRS